MTVATMRYLAEWLTVEQACHALDVTVDELRQLHRDGDVSGAYIRPGVWRVATSTVEELLANPTWKERAV
jgi:hypothetical protein